MINFNTKYSLWRGSMSNINMLLESSKKLSMTRRSFVKGSTALVGLAAMSGCSGSSNDSNSNTNTTVTTSESVYAGSAPHNCGGGCIIKAHVQDGVIKRFTTDETAEKTYLDDVPGDYMQERACPRCRSQKSWMYSSNRLMYPMIQTKERGDLTGFKRVTWEQASAYFKAKSEYVMKNYGPGAFHSMYSSGMGGGTTHPQLHFH